MNSLIAFIFFLFISATKWSSCTSSLNIDMPSSCSFIIYTFVCNTIALGGNESPTIITDTVP